MSVNQAGMSSTLLTLQGRIRADFKHSKRAFERKYCILSVELVFISTIILISRIFMLDYYEIL